VVWSQNHWNGFLRFGLKIGGDGFFWFDLRWFFSGLTSKSVTMISPELASKSVARVSQFETQNWQLRFGDLGLKITILLSLFRS
jgi:hypothetical protein